MSFFVTGIIGSCIYSLLFLGAVFHFHRSKKTGKTLITSFFSCMMAYSSLEIPRFIFMIIRRSDSSKVGYCLHVVAVGCYFVALSIICFSWMFLLSIEKHHRVNLSVKKLIVFAVNSILFIFILLSLYFCVTAHSLESYFDSKFYIIYMFVEVALFLFYNSSVVFFGVKISSRYNIYILILSAGLTNLLLIYLYVNHRFQNYVLTGGVKSDAFRRALIKVVTLMIVISICAVTRVTMLVLRILYDVDSLSGNTSYAHKGIIWFSLTDFIPFCIGGATFMFIMVTGSNKRFDGENPSSNDMSHSLLGSSGEDRKIEDPSRRCNINTPKQHHGLVVDSDIDNTPVTPEDENMNGITTTGDEEVWRAYSYDANSSITTNSPYNYVKNNEFSPYTPPQRWMSFNSAAMLSSSVSPPPNNSRQFAKSMPLRRSHADFSSPPDLSSHQNFLRNSAPQRSVKVEEAVVDRTRKSNESDS